MRYLNETDTFLRNLVMHLYARWYVWNETRKSRKATQ